VADPTVPRRSDAVQLAELLDSPEIAQLISELAATRWTGRPGYPVRMMVGMALAKSLYTLPTWTRTVALVAEHAALRTALGCTGPASVPSVHACYRFTAKLRKFKPLLDACVDRVTAALHEQLPELGQTVAIDASDMPAYANGQKYLYKGGPERKRYSDPDATWGHRSAVSTRASGSFYGTSCIRSSAPPSGCCWRGGWRRPRTRSPPSPCRCLGRCGSGGPAPRSRSWTWATTTPPSTRGSRPTTATRSSPCARPPPSRPASTARRRVSTARGRSPDRTPSGRRPSGAAHRGVLAREPVDRGEPAAHPDPRGTDRWKKLYRLRGSVERENGRLKHEWALLPLRVRRIERVALHADLAILARLTVALAAARAVPLAA
jgi:hypothetical protein